MTDTDSTANPAIARRQHRDRGAATNSQLWSTRRSAGHRTCGSQRARFSGFLGPNGAGKTTTIRLLLGFLRASAGGATIFGHDCWRHRALI